MDTETASILRMREYRGCGISAASYKVGARDWVPEACFWLHTENGWRRLWINSFAHCLATPEVTFANKIEADNWAFRMARTLIDKTLPEFDHYASPTNAARSGYLSKILKIARRPLAAYSIFKQYRYRN